LLLLQYADEIGDLCSAKSRRYALQRKAREKRMNYREENGQVVLTMSREDYNSLLKVFAAATAKLFRVNPKKGSTDWILALLNRLNQGNPNYTPYQVEQSCPTNEVRS
jgi:hypothetical protein